MHGPWLLGEFAGGECLGDSFRTIVSLSGRLPVPPFLLYDSEVSVGRYMKQSWGDCWVIHEGEVSVGLESLQVELESF